MTQISLSCKDCSHYNFCCPSNNDTCKAYDGWINAEIDPKEEIEYLVTVDNEKNGIYEEISGFNKKTGWASEICNYTMYDKKVIAWRRLPKLYVSKIHS